MLDSRAQSHCDDISMEESLKFSTTLVRFYQQQQRQEQLLRQQQQQRQQQVMQQQQQYYVNENENCDDEDVGEDQEHRKLVYQ